MAILPDGVGRMLDSLRASIESHRSLERVPDHVRRRSRNVRELAGSIAETDGDRQRLRGRAGRQMRTGMIMMEGGIAEAANEAVANGRGEFDFLHDEG